MKDNSILILFLFFTVIIYILYQIRYVDNLQPKTVYIDRTRQIYVPHYRYNRHPMRPIRPKRPQRPLPPARPMPPAEKILPIIPVEPLPRPDIKK
tara:strand:+ start:352 stop:636 length:285 start_codon:yes stop_codon:yes gene_type:complete